MWIYYILILLSVVMFGGGFACQNLYRKKRGSDLRVSMEAACIGSMAGLIVLLAINGFAFEYTPFTLLMAFLVALNSLAFTFCAFRALDYINLSLFSLFSMLGGMVLPFFQGILFYDEEFTLAKGVCVVFIIAALLCTLEKGEKKKGAIFYAGVFVLNGMSGVLSKIFTSSTLPKVSPVGYSVWGAAITMILSAIVWLVLSQREKRRALADGVAIEKIRRTVIWQSYGIGALNGAINKVANFLLVLALVHVDASIQYPMVTGGTMIVSTALSFFEDKKPNKKEILGVFLAFLGMLALFLIPV